MALIRRVWRWDEDGSHASTDELAWYFELHDHRVRSWRPFEDRRAALHAGGFDHGRRSLGKPLSGMADAAQTESVPARLAEIRDQLKLLADYL